MKGMELVGANNERFEMNQRRLADDMPLVIYSEKLCCQMSKFGRVYETSG